MKHTLFLILILCAAHTASAQTTSAPAPPDTVYGVAIVVVDLPVSLPSGAESSALHIQPALLYSVSSPKSVKIKPDSPQPVAATGITAKQIRYFYPDGTPCPTEDVLIFKKRIWKNK